MNSLIVNLIYALCAATFVSFLFEALMPEGTVKKYSGIALSIIVVTIIAMPIADLINAPDFLNIDTDFQIKYEKIQESDYKNFINEVYRRNL